MWSRVQLKEKAKYAMKQNYWKTILVTLIVFVIGGASTTFNIKLNSNDDVLSILFNNFSFTDEIEESANEIFEDFIMEDFYEDGFYENDFDDFIIEDFYEDDFYENNFNDTYDGSIYDGNFNDDEWLDDIYDETPAFYHSFESFDLQNLWKNLWNAPRFLSFAGIFIAIIILLGITTGIISILLSAFIHNPLEAGTNRFFWKNLNEKAEVKETLYAFDHSYKNVVKILFARDIRIFLWSLLFVIPGIVKSYEYRMIPYLLAENPALTKEDAFTLSRQMMTGNKWKVFVLDLSFIGWDILSACTLGILSVFYVQPYKNLTSAALYEELSLIHGRPAAFKAQNTYESSNWQPNFSTDTESFNFQRKHISLCWTKYIFPVSL